jgi:Na+-transporting methylmalonyl-CoA/oxaloacetate decarboxylase gamma subunit
MLTVGTSIAFIILALLAAVWWGYASYRRDIVETAAGKTTVRDSAASGKYRVEKCCAAIIAEI